jgi:hypothetical protein
MKTLVIKKMVTGTSTNSEAVTLFIEMKKSTELGDCFVLSFAGIDYVSSSFLNSSIGEYIETYGFDAFVKNIKFTDCNKDLATMIKSYVTKFKTLV